MKLIIAETLVLILVFLALFVIKFEYLPTGPTGVGNTEAKLTISDSWMAPETSDLYLFHEDMWVKVPLSKVPSKAQTREEPPDAKAVFHFTEFKASPVPVTLGDDAIPILLQLDVRGVRLDSRRDEPGQHLYSSASKGPLEVPPPAKYALYTGPESQSFGRGARRREFASFFLLATEPWPNSDDALRLYYDPDYRYVASLRDYKTSDGVILLAIPFFVALVLSVYGYSVPMRPIGHAIIFFIALLLHLLGSFLTLFIHFPLFGGAPPPPNPWPARLFLIGGGILFVLFMVRIYYDQNGPKARPPS